MPQGDVVWCDLSTFDLERTKAFYAALFGWTYQRMIQPDGGAYDVASTSAGEAAAIFRMPERFQKIGLPSFWMPYFSVDDVARACAVATSAGGKVEFGPLAWTEQDQIALIRDPLGAGFTVHAGAGLLSVPRGAGAGHPAWRALYVSDADAVRGFYETLFDWRVADASPWTRGRRVCAAHGATVTEIVEVGEEIRGSYEFWAVHFATSDLARTIERIDEENGAILYQDRAGGKERVFARDPCGAVFFVTPR